MENKTLGQKIEYYRKRAKMSQLDLEIAIGAGQGSISRIENGQVNPTKETLQKIIKTLSLSSTEAGFLFDIQVSDDLSPILRSTYNVFSEGDREKVFQETVESIVKELGFFSGFIVLQEGNHIYAKASTRNKSTELTEKLTGKKISEHYISMDEDQNFMVKSIKENRILTSELLSDFVSPPLPKSMSNTIQKVFNIGTCIVIPLNTRDKVIGAIMFGKNYKDDFSKEKGILLEYAKFISLALR